MKIEIASEKTNQLLNRKEIIFQVNHSDSGGTPSRSKVRERLVGLLDSEIDLIYVKKLITQTGTLISVGEATVYETLEQAKLVEPKHIIARNSRISKAQQED